MAVACSPPLLSQKPALIPRPPTCVLLSAVYCLTLHSRNQTGTFCGFSIASLCHLWTETHRRI